MSDEAIKEVEAKAAACKESASALASASSETKDRALAEMIEELSGQRDMIFDSNTIDLAAAREKGLTEASIERLTINEKRLGQMISGLETVIGLPDPVGVVRSGWRRPNGLEITKVSVPLGVIGIIYESRPNVTVDAASLCVKSGNGAVLRGGSEAIHTNKALALVLQAALEKCGIPREVVSLIESTDRVAARRLMTMNGVVDCLIPRGSASLIRTVVEQATVPVIETGAGNCHVYVHDDAEIEMAVRIAVNAKAQRPSVCNSAETLLVHRDIASSFLPLVGLALTDAGVAIRGDCNACKLIGNAVAATEEDWYEEYLALTIAVKVVETLGEAVAHINKYGTHHTESIITNSYAASQEFTSKVDSAAVCVNASTRFTDGFEFGFGAEIGISNQKLHARGPMGLEELTTYKYIIRGNGQVRE